jgi:hypothetical protein
VIAGKRLVGPIRLLYTELTFQGVNISAASLHRHNRSTPGFLRVKHREDLSLGVKSRWLAFHLSTVADRPR